MTITGREYLWWYAGEPGFSAAALAAIDADRQAITAFEQRDPGVADIRDFLQRWRDDLAVMERLVPRAVGAGGRAPIDSALCSAQTHRRRHAARDVPIATPALSSLEERLADLLGALLAELRGPRG